MMVIANPGVVCAGFFFFFFFAGPLDYMRPRREMRLLVLMQGPVSFRYCGCT